MRSITIWALGLGFIAAACATPTPTPTSSPVAITPRSSPVPVATTAGPSSTLAYLLDCGPLKGNAASCEDAAQTALRRLSMAPLDVGAIYVEAPTPGSSCAPSGGPIGSCRRPDIVVSVYTWKIGTLAGQVPLISNGTGWLDPALIR